MEILYTLLFLIRVMVQNNTACTLEYFVWHYINALKDSLCGVLILHISRNHYMYNSSKECLLSVYPKRNS